MSLVARSKHVYLRVSPAEYQALQRLAAGEDRRVSEVLYRAVRSYLSGGASQYAIEVREQAARYDVPDRILGDWVRELPKDTRLMIWAIGEATREGKPKTIPEPLRSAFDLP